MAANTNCVSLLDDLKLIVEKFLVGENPIDTVVIDSMLRRPIREFKQLYPQLNYFAYGLGREYTLILSKEKIRLDYKCLTPKCKKTFIENAGLCIDPNIDDDQIKKLDPYLNLTEWFKLFLDALVYVGGEKEFISKHFDLQNKIIDNLKKSPVYNLWKQIEILPKQLPYVQTAVNIDKPVKSNATKKINTNIYCEQNDGKYFLSIDLKAANFQAVRSNGLITAKSWQEYVANFIDHPYFGKLKKLRLKILSAPDLYPAKQRAYWSNVTIDILHGLIKNKIILKNNFAVWNSDEIVFHTTLDTMELDRTKCTKFIKEEFPQFDLSIDIFQLKQVANNKPYFVKINLLNDKIEFKCVNAQFLPNAVDVWTKKQSATNKNE